MKILAGNSNRALTEAIAAYLGLPLTNCQVRRFADMEIFVEIQENVRGEDTFVVQSTSFPANDHLMELLIMADALRRSSAKRITAVIPYFGYARQDRKSGSRTPISAKLVANLITRAGADRVLTVDLHAGQIQGFFDIPTDNLFAAPVMVRDIKERLDVKNVVVVSPDVGGVVRARALAKRIDASLAIVDKRRERAGESEVMNIIGEVSGRSCILVDDIVDSGGTLCNAADALSKEGATEVSRLHHARRALGRCGRAHRRLASQGAGRDRYHPADGSGARGEEHPRAIDRAADRRGDRAYGQRRKRLEPVRLGAAPAFPGSEDRQGVEHQSPERLLRREDGNDGGNHARDYQNRDAAAPLCAGLMCFAHGRHHGERGHAVQSEIADINPDRERHIGIAPDQHGRERHAGDKQQV